MKEETRDIQVQFNWKNIITVIFAIIVFVLIAVGISFALGKIPSSKKPEEAQVIPQTQENMELQTQDLVVGTGQEVKEGDTVSVNYVGTLTDGKEFDNSYKRGKPFPFTVGAGEVIRGWDEGLVGMKVGGKRKLTIPPELGYGKEGSPPVIPPNSTLVFEVELLEITK